MYNHETDGYVCPFCRLLRGVETEYNQQQDIVFQNEHVVAIIAPTWWVNNPGHVLVVPKKHVENLYDIDDITLTEVYKAVKKLAIAIRSTYGCDGVSTRQHNEPAGDQDVWHLHVHVYPRFEGDELYANHGQRTFADAARRLPYAEKLRKYFIMEDRT